MASLIVAVSPATGADNQGVATSPDGVTWTAHSVPVTVSRTYKDVIYADGQFVVVVNASFGSENKVATSPDGATWTDHPPNTSAWSGITHGAGTYVAVATSGPARVMTSPDGVTWTTQTPAAVEAWVSVAYGAGLFVAVASSGTGTCWS